MAAAAAGAYPVTDFSILGSIEEKCATLDENNITLHTEFAVILAEIILSKEILKQTGREPAQFLSLLDKHQILLVRLASIEVSSLALENDLLKIQGLKQEKDIEVLRRVQSAFLKTKGYLTKLKASMATCNKLKGNIPKILEGYFFLQEKLSLHARRQLPKDPPRICGLPTIGEATSKPALEGKSEE